MVEVPVPFDTNRIRSEVRSALREALYENDPARLVRDQVRLEGNSILIRGEMIDLGDGGRGRRQMKRLEQSGGREGDHDDDHENDLPFRRIHVLGAGKAAPFLFEGLYDVIGDWIFGGVVVGLDLHDGDDEYYPIELITGSHPIPDENSVYAGRTMKEYIEREIEENDLVFFLVTGGASALLELPLPPHNLSEIIMRTQELLSSGRNIREINCERRGMSAVKGGRLADMIHPARIVTLALSDIPVSVLDSDQELAMLREIGSGPTIPVTGEIGSGRIGMKNGARKGGVNKEDKAFILGRNSDLVNSLRGRLELEGMETTIVKADDSADVRELAAWYGDLIRERSHGGPIRRAFLSGGEPTVHVTGGGKGGRNQEFVLAVLNELRNFPGPFFVASIASDGIDGPTEAAGAWADHTTYLSAAANGLDPAEFLERNDSYHFFRRFGQLIVTRPTRTNVMDIRIVIV